jgi:hypothetical protein
MNITEEEFFTILNERYHYSLLDFLTRSKLESRLDTNLIPEEYKTGKNYYEKYSKTHDSPDHLPENHLLKKDTHSSAYFLLH